MKLWLILVAVPVLCGCPNNPPPVVVPPLPVPHAVTMQWNYTGEADTFTLYRGGTSGAEDAPVVTLPALPGITIYTDTMVQGGQTYYYVVRANQGGQISDPSDEVMATIPN